MDECFERVHLVDRNDNIELKFKKKNKSKIILISRHACNHSKLLKKKINKFKAKQNQQQSM